MNQTNPFHFRTKYMVKAILFCALFTGLFIVFSFVRSFFPDQFERFTHGILGTIAAFLATWFFLRIDRSSFADIGLKIERTTFKKFFAGVLIGIGIMGLVTLAVVYFSDFNITINKNSSLPTFLWGILPLLPLAFMEELGFRAYPMIILKNKTGIRNSILITSVLFALYHIVNGWAVQTAFLGAGVWGIVFGLAAIYSQGISMPTGIHFAANLTTSAFGVSNDSFNIWILKQENGSSLEHYQSSRLATLIPQISLLIFGIICMEWYLRKKSTRKKSGAE